MKKYFDIGATRRNSISTLVSGREGQSRVVGLLGDAMGAFADLGTLLPILLGLVVLKGFSSATLLLWVGVVYSISGAWSKIPLSVQPWKAACLVFLFSDLPANVLFATGIFLGAVFLVLGASRWIHRLATWFPAWVIGGIQFGLGLLLLRKGMDLLFFGLSIDVPAQPSFLKDASFAFAMPPGSAFVTALLTIIPAQFALSLGNSVLAAEATAKRYLGERAKRVSQRSLCFSIGGLNIVGGMLGLMPVCHGSGGITAHVKMGARSSLSNFVIGGTLVAASLWPALQMAIVQVPGWVLGVLLVYVGVHHALLLRGYTLMPWELFGSLTMGLIGIWSGSLLWAVLLGLGIVLIGHVRKRFFKGCSDCQQKEILTTLFFGGKRK